MHNVMPSEEYEGIFTTEFDNFVKDEFRKMEGLPGGSYFKIGLGCGGYINASIAHPVALHCIARQIRMDNPGFGYRSHEEMLAAVIDTHMIFIVRRRYRPRHDGDPMWAFSIVDPSSMALSPKLKQLDE